MEMTIDFARATAMEIAYWNRCALRMVQPENVFTFPEGILGFEQIKEYIFILNGKVKPFLFMQAMDKPDLCFVSVETFLVCPEFHITLPDSCVSALELESPSDALILSLVTVRQRVEEITANLMSPVVINMKRKKGRQVVVERSEFPVRYKVWEALEKGAPMMAQAV